MHRFILTALFAAILPSASASAAAALLTIPSADKKISITLEMADGWKTSLTKEGWNSIEIPRSGVHIQVAALGEQPIAEAATKIAELIKSEVTNFKSTSLKQIRIGALETFQVTGTGEEADDGDPSKAEIFIFAIEGKNFLICAHGEGDGTVKNADVFKTLLQSVKKL